MTHWRHAEATDTGLVRQSNQDAVYVDDSLAIVADGMGGHAAGEVASEMTIEMLRAGFVENHSVEGLYNAINAANITVLNDARENPNHFGMGTTVIALGLTVDDEGVTSPTLCHVGDSRAYQLRDGALRQLTDDHSVAEEWVRMGRLTPEEAAVHPRRHQLTRGVGVEETIAVDVMSLHALAGDRILLCSDGLSNELDSDTLARLASAPYSLEEAVVQLVQSAKEAGGRDNITAVLLEFDEVSVPSIPIKRTISTTTPPVARPTTAPTRSASKAPPTHVAHSGRSVDLHRGVRGRVLRPPLVRLLDVLPGRRRRHRRGLSGPAGRGPVVQTGEGLRHQLPGRDAARDRPRRIESDDLGADARSQRRATPILSAPSPRVASRPRPVRRPRRRRRPRP